jgi:glutathione S-transferase
MLESWFNSPTVTITEIKRDAANQTAVDAETAAFSLYHYDSCMFCARVRKAIGALSLNIELRDIMTERSHFRDLANFGGRTTVPCLRIGGEEHADAEWMFESADIIRFLAEKFGAS